jgi:hypothetical protein
MVGRLPFYFVFILLAASLAACNESDSEDDFPSNISIRGTVLTQNEFQQPLYEQRDGIDLLLEVGFREFEVDADNIGRWQLPGAPVGTYTFTVEKEGFGTVVYRGIKISTVNPEYPVVEGFQQIPRFILTEIPTSTIQDVMLDLSFETEMNGSQTDTTWSLTVSGTHNPGPPPTGQAKGCRVFLGTDEFVSSENYFFQEHLTTATPGFSTLVPDSVFKANQIGSGDVLHARIYPDANFDQAIELQNDVVLFPNLGESQTDVISVALP